MNIIFWSNNVHIGLRDQRKFILLNSIFGLSEQNDFIVDLCGLTRPQINFSILSQRMNHLESQCRDNNNIFYHEKGKYFQREQKNSFRPFPDVIMVLNFSTNYQEYKLSKKNHLWKKTFLRVFKVLSVMYLCLKFHA